MICQKSRKLFILFHHFFKTKKSIRTGYWLAALIFRKGHIGVYMMFVKKLDNMESAFIDVKVYVAFLKIGRHGFLDGCVGILRLYGFPGSKTQTVAVVLR